MLTINIPTTKDFWKAVACFAYRRWAKASPVKPVGVPGNRDPDAPCTSYAPRSHQLTDWGDCQTDGHYLCTECAHIARCSDCHKIQRECVCSDETDFASAVDS